jgi:hypothetical protein
MGSKFRQANRMRFAERRLGSVSKELQRLMALFSSVKTALMSGPSSLLHLHGIPAPHPASKHIIPNTIRVVFP